MEHDLCVAGFSLLAFAIGFTGGNALGRLFGYSDAQPKRDARGRFIKRG